MEPYGGMPDDRIVFNRMELFQRAAVSSLVKSHFVDVERWSQEEVLFLSMDFPKELAERATGLNARLSEITEIICQIKERYPLLGRNGLKDRSNLMEYRYDSV